MMDTVWARTPAQFEAVRALCWEYRDFLLTMPPADAELARQFYPEDGYTETLAKLDTDYVPPHGDCLLAMEDSAAVGCGMFHTLDPGRVEIKRVFVRPGLRGSGVGRAIMEALIVRCREHGASRILMDTSRVLAPAHALYLSLGFQEREPYYEIDPDVAARLHFYEMGL